MQTLETYDMKTTTDELGEPTEFIWIDTIQKD